VKFSSKHLAAFYYQLGTLVQAGIPIQNALASTQKTAPRPMRSTVAALAGIANSRAPLHEAMERCGRRFAKLDRHCVDVTERSGALDAGLLSLSKYYERLTEARRKLITGSLYPVFLVTAATFVVPVPELVLGKITLAGYLRQTVGSLASLVVMVWLAIRIVRWMFMVPGLNVTLDRLFRAVPVFGRLRFDYALSQWVSSIRLMLTAGIGIVPALENASRTSNSPLIVAAYEKAAPFIGGQLEVSQALAMTGEFPDHLIQFWATGEQSGKMDEMLDRLAKFYDERWHQSLDLAVTWLPRLAYLLAVLFMAVQIISGYTSYLNTYDDLLK
jgi:type II secretory pathway component PulF